MEPAQLNSTHCDSIRFDCVSLVLSLSGMILCLSVYSSVCLSMCLSVSNSRLNERDECSRIFDATSKIVSISLELNAAKNKTQIEPEPKPEHNPNPNPNLNPKTKPKFIPSRLDSTRLILSMLPFDLIPFSCVAVQPSTHQIFHLSPPSDFGENSHPMPSGTFVWSKRKRCSNWRASKSTAKLHL